MTTTLETTPARLIDGYQHGDFAVKSMIVVLASVALYNALELLILLWTEFKHYNSVYFWAMLLSGALGVAPASIGTLMDISGTKPVWPILLLFTIGFYFMVPGQSVVLYSRLHLVLHNDLVLRCFRYFIIIGTALQLIPVTVLYFCAVYLQGPWNRAYTINQRQQVTWFCAQECVISVVFIIQTAKLIKKSPLLNKRRDIILYQLVAVNLVVIMMDAALLLLEYLGLSFLQVTLKPTIYSIKLKLEFFVLGRLTTAVRTCGSQSTCNGSVELVGFIN
ncbi:hypothetical protein PHISCL_03173 [Aspergillus sclerotialis]|uniref:DUF7703 domain-containing protein n=1 Tax=Aspergillus sclerotialis TaxID=2070753 RepID=A0A3A3A542_9EURO|nr:hypothetical protein PHISCL_03173 [Aspergillus sclerotialis]